VNGLQDARSNFWRHWRLCQLAAQRHTLTQLLP
jgi:hypothetical protein